MKLDRIRSLESTGGTGGDWDTLSTALAPSSLTDDHQWKGEWEEADTSALAYGDPVYRAAGGTVGKALANDTAKMPAFGAVAVVGVSGKVLKRGIMRHDAWGFASHEKQIYITAAGALSVSAPTTPGEIGQIFGKVTSSDNVIEVKPELVTVEVKKGATVKKVQTAADGASITPNCDDYDSVQQTNTQGAGALTLNAPTGTPTNHQMLLVMIKATNQQTLTGNYNAIYIASDDLALPDTVAAGKIRSILFQYCDLKTKWVIKATDTVAA